MIIVGQEKNIIVNFDNVMVIRVEKLNCSGIDNRHAIFVFDNYRNVFNVGIYATEERAKEVLQEIIEVFTDEEMFHINKSSLNNLDELAEPKYILKPVSRPKVYEMPQK